MVYDEHTSGIATVQATKDYLTSKGFPNHLADKLFDLYLERLAKTSHVCSLMDLFTDAKSKSALDATIEMKEIYLNY